MHVLQRCVRAGVSPRARCAAASACALPTPPPPEPPLRVLCCSGDVAVFVKPAGMMVHPAPASSGVHARYAVHEAAAALARHGVSLAGGVHFVSRLDRGASGVLTACLSPAAAAALQAVWADAAVVSKEYLVLVAGHPQEDTWRDTRPLTARELGGGRRRRSSAPQEAVTDFSVLARFPAAPPALPFATALLSASPRTGRWHQIRRHLSGCGRHVLGDVSHGKLRYNGPARHALGLHRLFLHAAELRVAAAGMPGGGEAMRCVAPLPRELADAAARLPGWEQAAGKALRARGLLLPQDADGPGADDQAPS